MVSYTQLDYILYLHNVGWGGSSQSTAHRNWEGWAIVVYTKFM